MIENRHKGLRKFYENDDRSGVKSEHGENMTNMKNPSHPGDIIRECLEGLKLNITEGANALGVTRAALSRVLNAKASVSPEMAVRLSKAFGSTIDFWLRLQFNFDLALIKKKAAKIHVRKIIFQEQVALQ